MSSGHTFIPLDASATASPSADLAQLNTLKHWIRDFLALSDDDVITLHHLTCTDPGCPLHETVILVLAENCTLRWHLTHPAGTLTKAMLHQTLASPPRSSAPLPAPALNNPHPAIVSPPFSSKLHPSS